MYCVFHPFHQSRTLSWYHTITFPLPQTPLSSLNLIVGTCFTIVANPRPVAGPLSSLIPIAGSPLLSVLISPLLPMAHEDELQRKIVEDAGIARGAQDAKPGRVQDACSTRAETRTGRWIRRAIKFFLACRLTPALRLRYNPGAPPWKIWSSRVVTAH
jgi:hypothetical protein